MKKNKELAIDFERLMEEQRKFNAKIALLAAKDLKRLTHGRANVDGLIDYAINIL